MKNTQRFKDMLEKEMETILSELKTVGQRSDSNPSDWEAIETDALNIDKADDTEVAEGMEQFENNNAILNQLEKQLGDIKDALIKIEKGTYGICEVSGELIEIDRLEANPSARVCKLHMK